MAKIDVETPGTVTVNVQSRWRVLHRVPLYMRMDMKQIYDPVVVQLQLVEPLKDDKTLAEMMFRDACFLVCYMQGICNKEEAIYNRISQQLGMCGLLFMHRDMFILENQIPLWLISLIHNDHQSLLREFLSCNVFGDHRMTELPCGSGGGGGGEEEPLHLLEAFHRTHLSHIGPGKGGPRTKWQTQNRSFMSVKVKPRADNESIRRVAKEEQSVLVGEPPESKGD